VFKVSWKMIHKVKGSSWTGPFSKKEQQEAVAALEAGDVLYFPSLPFSLEEDEKGLLSSQYANPSSKNIGYDSTQKKMGGAQGPDHVLYSLEKLLARYAHLSQALIEAILPHYKETVERARTSYRPMEIEGRQSSFRKDDTRLHVDSFPSSPVQGKRILRVFTNINPHEESRLWRLGEPFQKVVDRFAPHCRKPFPGSEWLLEALKITKSKRTSYDHYMLQLHDLMKGDMDYQKNVTQIEFSFPPATTWIVYTDLTSHAAMKGQYALEQTFYLPVRGMAQPELSPLNVLETFFGRALV
jgi:hypothetical protein